MYRLLIVDDEFIERKAIRHFVEDPTANLPIMEVFEAENGREAIARAQIYRPELIIMDVRMPGIDGIEATRQIKGTMPDVIIILLTAFDHFEYAREGIRLNVYDYLTKPANDKQIHQVLHKACKTYEEKRDEKIKRLRIEEKYHQLAGAFQKELLRLLIEGKLSHEETTYCLKELGIQAKGSICCVVHIKEGVSIYATSQLYKRLEDIYRTCGYYPLIEWSDGCGFCLLLQQDEEHHMEELKEALNHLMAKEGDIFSYKIGNRVGNLEEVKGVFSQLHLGEETQENHMVRTISSICKHIDEYYDKDIRMDSFAKDFGFSKFYLSKAFKQHIGITFVDYLINKRVGIAMDLLQDTGKSIKEISMLVGYRDPNYFATAFRKHQGLSPTKYRQQINQDK